MINFKKPSVYTARVIMLTWILIVSSAHVTQAQTNVSYTQHEQVLIQKPQTALQRKGIKSQKKGNNIEALEYFIFGLLTENKVKPKVTTKILARLHAVYPSALTQWNNELTELGKKSKTTNVDRLVVYRQAQLNNYRQQLHIHQLLSRLPTDCGLNFNIDLLELEAEVDIAEMLLEMAIDKAAHHNFDIALQLLLEEGKESGRQAYRRLSKIKSYRPRKKFPGTDSLLTVALKKGTVTLLMQGSQGRNLTDHGDLVHVLISQTQGYMRHYHQNKFLKIGYQKQRNPDFIIKLSVREMEYTPNEPQPEIINVKKEVILKEGEEPTTLSATVSRSEQRLLSVAHVELVIAKPDGSVLVSTGASGTYIWTNTYATYKGDVRALKGSQHAAPVKKSKQTLPTRRLIAINSIEQAMAQLKPHINAFITKQMSH